MKKKVFCYYCKWYTDNSIVGSACKHKNNLKDTWFKEGNEIIRAPGHINEKNNCTWYKEK